VPWLRIAVEPNGRAVRNAHGLTVRSVIGEFRGVMEEQNHLPGGGESIPRGSKVPGKDLGFRETLVGKKTIGRFRVGPALANQRDALAYAIGQLLEKLSKTLVESGVSELAASKFPSDPSLGLRSGIVGNPPRMLGLLPLCHRAVHHVMFLPKPRFITCSTNQITEGTGPHAQLTLGT
jgi:hypothetical protein